jgi:cobalamin 5'-phosphate synthase/cobalamin synthase
MRRLAVAVAFLTRLPVPGVATMDAVAVGRAAALFPVAGMLLGGLLVAARHALPDRLPAMVQASLLLALLALLTGALHLDGLADTVDGLGGGRTREAALRIMRDHAVGAYGASSLILLLLVEAAALAALLPRPDCDRWLVLAMTVSRWAPVPLARALPYARPGGGLGAATTEHAGWMELGVASVITLGVAGWLGWAGLAALGGVALLLVAMGWQFRRRLGGVTGDTLGAAIVLSEVLGLLAGVTAG